MNKLTLIIALLCLGNSTMAQLGVLNKMKNKIESSKASVKSTSMPVIGEKELDEQTYADHDRLFVAENGQMIIKGVHTADYTDDINFSGNYYINTFAIEAPANQFSKDTAKAYLGFAIEYDQEKHTMQIHWDEGNSNYAMVPDRYKSSADKGNVMFQMGMTGGPSSWYNAECLLLEPGVILIGANVYHKNDEIGHQWMNNITPESFIIAAKDTTKFKEYEKNVEYTSKVVFEKFDALRAMWKNDEIKDAKPLPAEGMKNAALKSDALALIQRTAKGYKWKEEVIYAYVTSTDWEIKKHPFTGATLKRVAKAIVVMKTPQGNYKREGFYIAQDYVGGGNFGKTYMLYNDQRIYYVNPNDAMKYKN